jgi:H+-translocating NAD(P) transhydrogenase subunit alpha
MSDLAVRVGVPRESDAGEARVAIVPAVAGQLARRGLEVVLEAGAGSAAGFPDDAYTTRGAHVARRDEVLGADVLVRVRGWGDEADASHPDQAVVGLADPLGDLAAVRRARERKLRAFALELVPRTTRAQLVDALSSQATIVGYRAVLLAASRLPKLFPMLTTAAGTVPPAQVFVVGAGVAGLQAIATARRLGAVVRAYDVRPAAQEDIESLGATAVLLPLAPGDAQDASGYAKELGPEFYRRQQELLADATAATDVVITTASIPGRPGPRLVTAAAVERMRPGSVVVDCAAERGGNCDLTQPGRDVVTGGGVSVLGPLNLPATVPQTASELYARNIAAFLDMLIHDGRVEPDPDDEIVAATLVTSAGEIVSSRVAVAYREVFGDE